MTDWIVFFAGGVFSLLLILIGTGMGFIMGAKQERLDEYRSKLRLKAYRMTHREPSGSIKAKTIEEADAEDRKPLMEGIEHLMGRQNPPGPGPFVDI